jgi:hypothetical protein
MKKALFGSILGTSALFSVAISSYGQGKINLNNYVLSGNQITYAANWGPSLAGTGLQNGTGAATWTIGFYYALGDVTASVGPDATGERDPSTLGGGLGFATGVVGDTTTIKNLPGGGYFTTTSDAIINGWSAGAITIEVVAYSGPSFNNSLMKAHSAPFLLTPVASSAPQAAPPISTFNSGMPGFSVLKTPEPSSFALASIGSALFLLFRRNGLK